MTTERERTLAGAAAVAAILVWFGLAVTVFYVPRLSVLWAELGTPPSPARRLLLALCRLTGYNVVAGAGVLLAATGVAFWWRLQTSRRVRGAATDMLMAEDNMAPMIPPNMVTRTREPTKKPWTASEVVT